MFKECGDEGEVWYVYFRLFSEALESMGLINWWWWWSWWWWDRFGEDSAEQMVEWMEENRPDKNARIIDCKFPFNRSSLFLLLSWHIPETRKVGCGNGHLLQLLHLAGYTNLLGVDYSEASIDLARSISAARGVTAIRFEVRDIFTSSVSVSVSVSEEVGEKYDVVLDKGTYDAISLSDEMREEKLLVQLFPEKVRELIAKDGVLLITSCWVLFCFSLG